jgi:hypothetical protein
MSDKIRQILLTLVILFIATTLADEGRTFLLISDSLEIPLSHDHFDLEIPHQHNFKGVAHDEECLGMNLPSLNSPCKKLFLTIILCDIKPQDYPGLIWQPPKSV